MTENSKSSSGFIQKKKIKKETSKKEKVKVDRVEFFWLKKILKGISIATLCVGIYFTLIMFYPLPPYSLSNTLAMFLAQISGFLLFLYLLTTLLLLKLTDRYKVEKLKRKEDFILGQQIPKVKNPVYKIFLVVGLSLAILNSLPIMSTPFAIDIAEGEFEEAYGTNWRDQIPENIKSYFLPNQFDLTHYFLGWPQKECNVDTNIKYYEDEDVTLYFDVYYPEATDRELPGHNSTIIKIHGGGWTQGDKGIGNMLWVSRYLAAQGYIVFDIQYGLFDTGESPTLPTSENTRSKNIDLHDMIYQIGYFTKQLEDTLADKYQANLNSVFVMGGSAGGHLTCMVGMGYNDEYFAGNYSSAIKIKGIVPYYPANNAERIASGVRDDLIPGTPKSNPLGYKKFTPSNLADSDDPSCLIFHGAQDWVVSMSDSEEIEDALEDENVNCLLLSFPTAAHANDYIASNNYQQVFLYYLERFLYLEQHT
ncbi:MAG: alpha/beta hydrolase family protein [Promethearchaeota archaeon]